MDFRILGSLEVWEGPDLITVAGRLHPKIIAGLLLNAGHTVSLSWLVELLWDDAPPASARRQAQNAVAALRRRLAPARANLIERIGQQYRLDIAEDELDLRRFEDATWRARQRVAAGAMRDALVEYELALGLWRGSALAGLRGRTFEAAAARLNDLRLSAYEEYAEAALCLGESGRVLAKLHELVGENPLRQRLAARLMHALYQSGQAPEAIGLFDSIRTRLAHDLGIDPGVELRQLHVRILQDDPDLSPQNASALTQRQIPVPAELPADVSVFTGRSEELAALDRLRGSGARAGIVSTIAGIGGVGKTALAVHWSHARRDRFPDGQLYLNLRGFDEREPLTAHEAVSRLLRSLGQSSNEIPADVNEAAALYRSLLADRRVLVVLDNARSLEHIQPLMPGSPGCLALITSRNSLSDMTGSHGAHHVHLGALTATESLDLLTHLLGPGSLTDVDAMRELARLCGHLPLALRIAAANLASNPHATLSYYVAELADGSRLSKLSIDGDRDTNLTAVFDLSFRALDDKARNLFVHLGLIPGEDFTASLGSAIAELTAETVQCALEQLETAHLVEQHRPGRFRFHDLVRLFARDAVSKALTRSQRESALDRMLDWYGDRSNPYLPEFDNVMAACEAMSTHPRLWKAANTLGLLANAGRHSRESLRFAEFALRTSETIGDVEGQIYSLDALGGITRATGDNARSIELRRQAARLLPLIDNAELEGKVNNNLGIALNGQGNLREAAHHQLRAVQVAEAGGLRELLAVSLGNLGAVYRSMGMYTEALNCVSRAERIWQDAGASFRQASLLITLGLIYSDIGEYENARQNGRRALDIAEELGETKAPTMALQLLGLVAHRSGDLDESLQYYERAGSILSQDPNIGSQIWNLHFQADLFLAFGEAERTFACLESARRLAAPRRLGSAEQASEDLILGRAHLVSGDVGKAIEHGERAAALYRAEHSNPLQLGSSLEALGEAYYGDGCDDKAATCWNKALIIFTELGVPDAARLREKMRRHSVT